MADDDDEPSIDLDDFDPPNRPDFRRVGRGIPFVLDPSGKRTRYSRSSNAGKILDDESNLTDWKLRTVVAGAAQRPELMAMASTLDVDSDKKALRDIAEECLVAGKGQRRSIIGTAVHSMFDHIDRNDGWVPPPQFNELVDAYVATLEIWGLVPEAIEVQVINDQYRLAGTLDRLFRTTKTLVAPDGTVIPIGSTIIADTKTGKELEYASGSYATQLAAYVDSLPYDVKTDERGSWGLTSPNSDWALIIHADSAGERVDVYWVDIRAGRLGLALAREVKAWRKRDDLLTLAQRFTVVDSPKQDDEMVDAIKHLAETVPVPVAPPPPGPDVAPLVPVVPVDGRREESRIEYLRGRVRAVMEHSDTAKQALARAWPTGVPGLKQSGHSMDQLDLILDAVELVEKDHSIGFYPSWDDPAIDESRLHHPSYIAKWSNPSQANPATDDERETVRAHMDQQPRSQLLRQWIGAAIQGGIDSSVDTFALANALSEFASIDEAEWPDEDLTTMLDGSLRALGYQNGINELGRFNPNHAPLLMSAAFAITAGNAMLLFDDEGKPVVRTNVVEA